ncbi:hypothetical protein HNR02_004817 [Amycolatopsis endophytica]|uniref:Uncharacterized protein n=1 Tax=Amycolatopsis endophytica TaxID=860233 RepID=A0A853B9P7_9PSEU|nr:hypothetical protein [Amycolatopsis endophytica]
MLAERPHFIVRRYRHRAGRADRGNLIRSRQVL